MDTHTRIRDAVFSALDQLNEQLPPPLAMTKSDETALTGPDSPLDSLGVVNLIAVLEQIIDERFGGSIDLIDNGLFGEDEPLQNVGTLVAFVTTLLAERAHV